MRSSISSDPPMTNVAVFELGLPWDAVSLLSKGEQLLGEKTKPNLASLSDIKHIQDFKMSEWKLS